MPRASGRWSPSLPVAIGAAVALAATGLLFSRPDIVALGLPLALWSLLAVIRGTAVPETTVTLDAVPSDDGETLTSVTPATGAKAVEIFLVQSGRRTRRLIVPGTGAPILSRSRVLHSGPATPVQVVARSLAVDGAILSAASEPISIRRMIEPPVEPIDALPLPRRMTGLHGAHDGRRVGRGGDFRDIHRFVQGDELRRVDWRATARLARRPGDLLVRRTDTLSDASVVIAIDTSEDLGEVVASWGSGDFERSGVTSLDNARRAGRSIARAAIGAGDRVGLHVLVHGGRSLRSGAGSRHLARLEATIAAVGQADDDATFRRSPHVPHGSVVFILSTFLEGAAAQTALLWRAGGHRVVAVDVLPHLDRSRLSQAQAIGLRTVMAERENVLTDLRGAGVDVVPWAEEPEAAFRLLARSR